MHDPTLPLLGPLLGMSPVSGKRVDVRFDGGLLSSDGGILLLREVEQRLGVAAARCLRSGGRSALKRCGFAMGWKVHGRSMALT